jgi:hypothetical protein
MSKHAICLAPGVLFFAWLVSLPALRSEEPAPITKADLQASASKLKQIGIAFHHYYSSTNQIPSDILDKTGKPLLSWRVALLPYLDQEALYKQFKRDEPWDSDTNKELIDKMPDIYAPVRVKAKAGATFYQTFTGEGTVFVKHVPLFKISNIPDGTSKTGMVFEAGTPVIWSTPVDLAFDAKKSLPKLGGLFEGEIQVVMFDGHVCHLRKNPDEQELKKLIMADSAMPLDWSKLDKRQGGS